MRSALALQQPGIRADGVPLAQDQHVTATSSDEGTR